MPEPKAFERNVAEIVNTWTQVQQQFWDSWLGVARGRRDNATQQPYNKPLDIMEEMVDRGLMAQSEGTKLCLNLLSVGVTPPPKFWVDWIAQLESMIDTCAQSQRQAWKSWITLVRENGLYMWPSMAPTSSQSLLNAWQEATDQAFALHKEWMKLTTPMMAQWEKGIPEPVEVSTEASKGDKERPTETTPAAA